MHEFAYGGSSAASYSEQYTLPGASITFPAAHRADLPLRWPRDSATERSARTRAVPFARPPRTAAWSVSSLHTDA
jgi:hypothetical protein